MVQDVDLFEILAREHAETLAMFLKSAVRDPELADDLFQETLLRAWQNLEKFDRNRSFGAWLRGIATRLILEQRRKTGRRSVLAVDPQVLQCLDESYEALQRHVGDTLDDKLRSLEQCLEDLPGKYRTAVELRYMDGLRGTPLADKLQISLENSKKRLLRGRERLLECVKRKLAQTGAAE